MHGEEMLATMTIPEILLSALVSRRSYLFSTNL